MSALSGMVGSCFMTSSPRPLRRSGKKYPVQSRAMLPVSASRRASAVVSAMKTSRAMRQVLRSATRLPCRAPASIEAQWVFSTRGGTKLMLIGM